MTAYDGNKEYRMVPGDYSIARKNHLIRYTKYKDDGQFEKVIITFDEPFLRRFMQRHDQSAQAADTIDSFLPVPKNALIDNYMHSLAPYYNGSTELDSTFADINREELLLILLRINPGLANIFFTFGIPEKIDLESFMLRNFRFNVTLERFAFMTGRSLSGFKRDFRKVFGTTPGNWLREKRLEEAYFRLSRQKQRPSDVYLEVGFEDFSHFSYQFRKTYGKTPSEVAGREG